MFGIRQTAVTDALEGRLWRGRRAGSVASYTIYVVAPGGRLQLGGRFECTDDAAAIDLAPVTRRGEAIELWEGGRLVGRFSKLGVFTPAEA